MYNESVQVYMYVHLDHDVHFVCTIDNMKHAILLYNHMNATN